MTVRWPLRPRTREALLEIVSVASPLVRGRWWPLLALAVGTVPLLIGAAILTSLHQIATGLLLGPLFWACIRDDRLGRAIGITALVIMSHSVLAIALAAHQPERMAAILPGSAEYWERTRHWIQTGDDPEYRIAEWFPHHIGLFLAATLVGGLSLGLVPFALGVEQVDLMNFYVGRLIAESESPTIAVLFGWHPWSILRGLACTVLIFETASQSLEWLSVRTLSTRRRRQTRWALGIGLAIADAVTKQFFAPFVRDQLFWNLSGDASG